MSAQLRAALYALAVAVAALLVTLGVIDAVQSGAILKVVEAALALIPIVSSLVALRHVTPDKPSAEAYRPERADS